MGTKVLISFILLLFMCFLHLQLVVSEGTQQKAPEIAARQAACPAKPHVLGRGILDNLSGHPWGSWRFPLRSDGENNGNAELNPHLMDTLAFG
jgi:hypothetical protein